MTNFEIEEENRKQFLCNVIEIVLIVVLAVIVFAGFIVSEVKSISQDDAYALEQAQLPHIRYAQVVSEPDPDLMAYKQFLKDQETKEPEVPEWEVSDTPEEDELDDQFEELCQAVMDEGGYTEPDDGLRMMADGILNRMDSDLFPDTIHEVIWQKGQFACTSDFYKWEVTERVIRICAEEMEHRTNTQVLYWRTDHYHAKTTPIAKIGRHYYSGK